MKKLNLSLILIFVFISIIYAESLWDEGGGIYSTTKKWKVGDSLKIIFNEKSLVDYRMAVADMAKVNSQGEGGKGVYLNFLPSIGGSDNFSTSQKSTTKNKSKLNTSITVKINSILPNGNLSINGTHLIQVNNQQESITVSGEVNPKDIKKKKYIYSTDIINATISYKSQIIKPNVIKPSDFVQTFKTNISIVSGKTQVNITSQYEISKAKKNQLIIDYLNKILSILFRKP